MSPKLSSVRWPAGLSDTKERKLKKMLEEENAKQDKVAAAAAAAGWWRGPSLHYLIQERGLDLEQSLQELLLSWEEFLMRLCSSWVFEPIWNFNRCIMFLYMSDWISVV